MGDWSTLPAASIARTWNVCAPGARPVYALGDEHEAKAAPSRAHWNVRLAAAVTLSLPEKENEAFVSPVVAGGWAEIVVSGAAVSGGATIVQLWLSAAPRLPAASAARTSKVCSPSGRSPYRAGLSQPA